MYIMIAAYALVLMGFSGCIVHEYLQLQQPLRRHLRAAAIRKVRAFILLLLLTIGPSILLVWVLWRAE
jgi:hypothetical protein